jgi:hypothetical protein
MSLHIVGVRHHSPACARQVAAAIEAIRPAWVLIEGPADMNDRIGELLLDHEPPIAIFTHYATPSGPSWCFSPFMACSPEWVALQRGAASGAQLRFIDLPAWDKALLGVRNRFRDGAERYATRIEALCQAVGVDDMDALWEHLFEGELPLPELEAALSAYFVELRGEVDGGPRDGPREQYMRDWIAWALGQGGPVLAVVGGWHAPALRGVLPAICEPPPIPPPTGEGSSHLVPWSQPRLDSFSGYEAGMPSPGFQEDLFNLGGEAAVDRALNQVVAALRQSRVRVSVADHIAARSAILSLARLRGHRPPRRLDLLDGAVLALHKEPLPEALPWSRRGRIDSALPPVVATLLSTLTGDRSGRLAASTPRPPLVQDVEQQLRAAGLFIPRPLTHRSAERKEVALDWRQPDDRPALRLLHRLRVLGIPGFERRSGPKAGTDAAMREAWRLSWSIEQEAALIEASRWGATLLGAVSHKLSRAVVEARGLGALSAALVEAIWVGLRALAEEVLPQLLRSVHDSPQLAELGSAVAPLYGLWRAGDLVEAEGSPLLQPLLREAGERALTLMATVVGDTLPPEDMVALITLRPLFREGARLELPPERVIPVLDRRSTDRAAPPMLRGAALGLSWSLDRAVEIEVAIEGARVAASEGQIGDFLAGLFAMARGPALRDPGLISAVDTVVGALTDEAFLAMVPSLRLAFSYFPPAEREQLAEHLRASWGWTAARDWWDAPAEVLVEGLSLDARVEAWGQSLGLWEADDGS